MPKVSAAYVEQRRDQVLDAALRCFGRRGFAGTTMKDIAREAGVSYGVVYHYFRSKEEIIALGSAQAEARRELRFEQAERHESAADALEEYVRLTLGRWADPSSAAEIAVRVQIVAESAINETAREVMRSGLASLRSRLAAALQRGQDRGEIAAEFDPEGVATVLVALNEGIVALKAHDPQLDARVYLHTVEQLLTSPLLLAAGKEHNDEDARDASAGPA